MKRTLIIGGSFGLAILLLVVVSEALSPDVSLESGGTRGQTGREGSLVRVPIIDPRTGRKQIEIEAISKDSAELRLTGGGGVQHDHEFGKGWAAVPVGVAARDGDAAGEPMRFRLDFEEARFTSQPGAKQRAHIALPRQCTGSFDDGTTVQFESLNVDWESPGRLELVTVKPVVIERENPHMKLIGKAGMRGLFDGAEGVSRLEFPAPVYAFLRRDAGSTLLGLGEERASGAGGVQEQYVLITCDGSLVLDWEQRTLTLERKVGMTPRDVPEVPVTPIDAQKRFVLCHSLVVRFDAESNALAGAEALRGPDDPVRGRWSGEGDLNTVYMTSGRVTWDAATNTAEFTGAAGDAPHMVGKAEAFRFDARAARIVMDNRGRVAKLYGPIRSLIEQRVAASGRALPRSWELDADYGEVFFAEKDVHAIETIVVSADPALAVPNAVRFRSRGVPGEDMRADGGRLEYVVRSRRAAVTGLPGRRPFVHAVRGGEELHAEAQQVNFSFAEGAIVLENGAQAWLRQEGERAGERTHRLFAHWARISGSAPPEGESSQWSVARVEALARSREEPLRLEYDGPPRCRLEGGALHWDREKAQAIITPHEQVVRQRIVLFADNALECRELRFVPEPGGASREARIYALGDVEVRLNTAQDDFRVHADEVECSVEARTVQEQEHGPPALSALRSITARAAPGKKVALKGNHVECAAAELLYDAAGDTVVLKGPGAQEFRYQGADGLDTLAAQQITFVPSQNRLLLAGGVAGVVHQKNWSENGAAGRERTAAPAPDTAPATVPETPWAYEAKQAEAGFVRRESRWELEFLTADGGIRLHNPEVKILVTGDRVEFDPRSQTITLSSPRESAGFQTLRHGTPPDASWLSARRITIQRRERLDRGTLQPEVLGVLSEDVTCNFHLLTPGQEKTASPLVPERLSVIANRVRCIVPVDRTMAGEKVLYAEATGHVGFQASARSTAVPMYSGSAARAEYHHSPMRLTLFGDDTQGRAWVDTPIGRQTAPEISLRRRNDGSLQIKTEGVEHR